MFLEVGQLVIYEVFILDVVDLFYIFLGDYKFLDDEVYKFE
jgi:hypothetical protein